MIFIKKLFKRKCTSFITSKGSRQVNEDYCNFIEDGSRLSLYVLCDGLGGHGLGDIASQCVTENITTQFLNATVDEISTETLESFVCNAQDTLLKKQEDCGCSGESKMRTTCVAMITDKENAYICHVGDSRLYAFTENGELIFRTRDHSVPEMLHLSGLIEEKEIRHHPDRNKILRCLGIQWDKSMCESEQPIKLSTIGAFLLCSDGFWELCDEDSMCKLLKESNDSSEWLKKMEAIVKENGKDTNMDNYTAIAVFNKHNRRRL